LPDLLEQLMLRLLDQDLDASMRHDGSAPYLCVRLPGSVLGVSVHLRGGEFRIPCGDREIVLGGDLGTAAATVAELCTGDGVARALLFLGRGDQRRRAESPDGGKGAS
jgi:hypothetical protein